MSSPNPRPAWRAHWFHIQYVLCDSVSLVLRLARVKTIVKSGGVVDICLAHKLFSFKLLKVNRKFCDPSFIKYALRNCTSSHAVHIIVGSNQHTGASCIYDLDAGRVCTAHDDGPNSNLLEIQDA